MDETSRRTTRRPPRARASRAASSSPAIGGVGVGAVLGGLLVKGLLLPDEVLAIPASEGYLLVDTKKCSGCNDAACWRARWCTTARRTSRCRASRSRQTRSRAFPERHRAARSAASARIPACVEACPTGAMHVDAENGNVRTVDARKCIGCERCIDACPFTPVARAVEQRGEARAEVRPVHGHAVLEARRAASAASRRASSLPDEGDHVHRRRSPRRRRRRLPGQPAHGPSRVGEARLPDDATTARSTRRRAGSRRTSSAVDSYTRHEARSHRGSLTTGGHRDEQGRVHRQDPEGRSDDPEDLDARHEQVRGVGRRSRHGLRDLLGPVRGQDGRRLRPEERRHDHDVAALRHARAGRGRAAPRSRASASRATRSAGSRARLRRPVLRAC